MKILCNNRNCKEARMAENLYAIDKTIKSQEALVRHLANLLEFVKGNRGPKNGNPYGIIEVKEALKHLAELEGIKDYLSVDTRKLSGWICKECNEPHFRCCYCAEHYCLLCHNESCPYCHTAS